MSGAKRIGNLTLQDQLHISSGRPPRLPWNQARWPEEHNTRSKIGKQKGSRIFEYQKDQECGQWERRTQNGIWYVFVDRLNFLGYKLRFLVIANEEFQESERKIRNRILT